MVVTSASVANMNGEHEWWKVVVQQVEYPYDCHYQHRARLHMWNVEYNCELQSVVSVRAVLHFLHLWQRNAKKEKDVKATCSACTAVIVEDTSA